MKKPLIKIAIVEDDLSILQMYTLKLELEGYQVRSAADGQSGLKMIEEFRPDLVLLDLRMPIMSGETMLEKLRAEDWGGSIRVIILTNLSRDEAPRSLQFLAVDRYIVKAHHTPAQVVGIIQDVLR